MKKAIIPSMLVLMVSSYFLYQHLKKDNFKLNQMVIEDPSEDSSSNNTAKEESPQPENLDSEISNELEETEVSENESEKSDSPFPTISIKKKPVKEEQSDEEDEEVESSGLMKDVSFKEINKAVKKFKEIDPELGKEVEEHVNAPEDEDLDLDDY